MVLLVSAAVPTAASPKSNPDRDFVHGWTWALLPDAPGPRDLADESYPEPQPGMASLASLALAAPGSAFLGGVLSGPIRFDRRFVPRGAERQGFVAHVDGSGSARLVRLFAASERRDPTVTALAVDRASNLVGASEAVGLFKMTASGRTVWSVDSLAPATAIAIGRNGDVFAGGCIRGKGPVAFPGAKVGATIRDGYLAGVSRAGRVTWRFLFGKTDPAATRRTCVTAVASGPSNDVFVAGIFLDDMVVGADTLRSSRGTQFVARFSADGKAVWGRVLERDSSAFPLAPGASLPSSQTSGKNRSVLDPVRLTVLDSGKVVIAGDVVGPSASRSAGLAVLTPEGTTAWLLPVDAPAGSAAFTHVDRTVVASRADEIWWSGTFQDSIRVGGRTLSQPDGVRDGLFVARVDRDGRVLGLDRPPTGRSASGQLAPGQNASPAAISATRGEIWIAGNLALERHGAFAHRLRQ
jgi:hypothetical protein